MLIAMKHGATDAEIARVIDTITQMGFTPLRLPGTQRVSIGIIGNDTRVEASRIELLPGVANVIHVTQPYKLVSREWHPEPTRVRVGEAVFGGDRVVLIAGPCAVESEDLLMEIAGFVKAQGALILRGGAYKPRTSPYSFQGLGLEGLKLLQKASKRFSIPTVTEVLDPSDAETVAEHVDILQVGARNMQNFSLLRKVGSLSKPVLLKRGMSATVKEFLMAAEYILAAGNPNVILCERGIRTFEDMTRFTFDLSAISVIREVSHLPIIADPSHSVGAWNHVLPMARAAVAAGADGLMIDVHDRPELARCDGAQALKFDRFADLVNQVGKIATAVGRAF